jgi:hypothetical protein
VLLAGVGVTRNGAVKGKVDVKIDAITAPNRLTVTSGRDITLGDGTSSVAGVISLNAPQNVLVELASAKIDSITAGVSANLRGGAIEVNTIAAPRMFAQASSLRIGTATTSGDFYAIATNGDAIVGSVTAGDDIFVLATNGTASLQNGVITGNAPDVVQQEFVGNPDQAANGRVVRVESTNGDARLGLGTGGVTGATSVAVRAGRDAAVEVVRELPGAFSVIASRDATLRAPTVRLDAITAGRDLALGSTVGDFTLLTSLNATRNVTITAVGALRVGDVRADQGSVTLQGSNINAGAVSASEDLTLRATSGGVTTTSYRTGRDLFVQGRSLSLGSAIGPTPRDLTITSLGDFTATSPLTAGRNLTFDIAGRAVLGATTAAGTTRISAGDLDLTGLLSAANVQIESRNGAMRVGGASGGQGFVFDANDFGQLRVPGETRFFAGSTTGGTRGDLTLQTLTVNPGQTPNVSFMVGSANNASVTGLVAPTADGGVLRIGSAGDLSWRPNAILVSGAVGAATFSSGSYRDVRAFNEVRLAASQDIIFGSLRFITLIQGTPVADIDIALGRPTGVAPTGDEIGRVFVSAGKLEVSSENKVVQQNTAPIGFGQAVGVFFTGQSSTSLIIDPPKIVELWGAFAVGGNLVSGINAVKSLSFEIVDVNGNPISRPDGSIYRFNSCDVNSGSCNAQALGGGSSGEMMGQVNSGVLSSRDALPPPQRSGPGGDGSPEEVASAVSAADAITAPPVILGVTPPTPEEIVTDAVTTGTGSEEIWRKRRQRR